MTLPCPTTAKPWTCRRLVLPPTGGSAYWRSGHKFLCCSLTVEHSLWSPQLTAETWLVLLFEHRVFHIPLVFYNILEGYCLRNKMNFYFLHLGPFGCYIGFAEALASQPSSKRSTSIPISRAMCPRDSWSYNLQADISPSQEEVWVQCKCTECLQKDQSKYECLLLNAASSGAF